jgi:hypothetical protein
MGNGKDKKIDKTRQDNSNKTRPDRTWTGKCRQDRAGQNQEIRKNYPKDKDIDKDQGQHTEQAVLGSARHDPIERKKGIQVIPHIMLPYLHTDSKEMREG